MEIIVFVVMMIVPLISVAALFMAILNAKHVRNLRDLVKALAKSRTVREDSDALGDFVISEM